MLTDAKIKALKPRSARYLITDGRGLSLDILPSGTMSWLYRYRLDGKYGKVILGRYPDLPLKEARAKRDKLAGRVAQGESPALERKLARAGLALNPTVKEFGERYYKEQVIPRWKSPSYIRRYLDNEIYPVLGDKTLNDVGTLDVQALVYRKRDNGRVAAAMRLRNVIKQMFDYALELQLVTVNPAATVATRYIGKARSRTRALMPKEIRVYLRTIYQSNIRRQFKLALHILLLTLCRKSELRLARWNHLNFEAGEWLIPDPNVKTKNPHVVYMSRQVMEMFRELKALAGGSEYVLPGRSSLAKPFSSNALNQAMQGLTFDIDSFTIHDSRRTASTLLHEKGFPSDVIEKALNHKIGGVRGVYNRAEYADQRKQMLQWWADYVDSIVTESNVIVGNFGRSPA